MSSINLVEQPDTDQSAAPAALPQMRRLAPVLHVGETEKTTAYLQNLRGFNIPRLRGEPGAFTIANRDRRLPGFGHDLSGANNG